MGGTLRRLRPLPLGAMSWRLIPAPGGPRVQDPLARPTALPGGGPGTHTGSLDHEHDLAFLGAPYPLAVAAALLAVGCGLPGPWDQPFAAIGVVFSDRLHSAVLGMAPLARDDAPKDREDQPQPGES